MQYALINNSEVVNVIIADSDFIQSIQADYDHIEPLDTLIEQGLGVGIGWGYVNGEFVAPPQPELPEPTSEPRHISVGAFFDRFGAAKYAILADTNPTVQALVKDASVRKFIDLDRADLPAGLQLIVDAGHDIDIEAIISNTVLESEKI